ncbi:MAG TPA: iron ABC transporter permease [Desulfobacterales bacterium]|nr:iron ABC transporter permease [Desulfobacterales bacterium]
MSFASPPISLLKVVKVSGFMLVFLLLGMLGALLLGTADVGLKDFLDLIFIGETKEETVRLIIFKIRLPRIILAGLAGFTLSVGGTVFQAILRNPLADPFILGVSSGAAFGAVLGIVAGLGFGFGIPACAFAGAFTTIALVMLIARRKMGMESATTLLAGVIVNAFFTAIIMFFVATSTDDRLHTMLFWLYGDLSQSRMGETLVALPVVAIGFALLYGFANHLNLIAMGEESALHMGVDVEKAKICCFLGVSLITGLIVSFTGLIGFVGLIVPHILRMLIGSDHRLLLPVAGLGGAIFLIWADTLARTVVQPSEIPVGVITAALGAPFFIYLLRKRGGVRHWN